MTKENIQHYSIRKLFIGAISVIVSSFFLTSGQTVHADAITDANSAQTQSNNNESVESIAIDTKQVVMDQIKTNHFTKSKVEAIKKANTSIMSNFKIALSSKKLAINKIQLHNKSIIKTKLHKIAALCHKRMKMKIKVQLLVLLGV